jgi:hypothetical protein
MQRSGMRICRENPLRFRSERNFRQLLTSDRKGFFCEATSSKTCHGQTDLQIFNKNQVATQTQFECQQLFTEATWFRFY